MLEAGVAPPAVGVEDPEAGPSPRRPEPAPPDRRLGLLTDDVLAEPDPGPPGEHEAERGGLRDRGVEIAGAVGRLDDDEERRRPTGDRGEPAEPLDTRPGRPHGPGPASRTEVEHDDVDRPSLEERPGHRQRLVERGRSEDREVVEPDAAGDGLDRVERPGDVHPGRERARGLGLGDEPERERQRSARPGATERDRRGERDAARAEDRIERGEAGRDDLPRSAGRSAGSGRGQCLDRVDGERRDREGAVGLGPVRPKIGGAHPRIGLVRPRVALETPSRSCRAPPRPEGRESGGDIPAWQRHHPPR